MINESRRSGQAWHVLRALLLGLVWTSMPQPVIAWETLEPGVELRWLTAKDKSSIGDSRVTVLRIDPAQWQLDLVGRSLTGEPKGQTARECGAGIGLVALQHLEGGPEAQLYWKLGGQEVELVGSYETFFLEADTNLGAWPIPNVLGLRRRAAPKGDSE